MLKWSRRTLLLQTWLSTACASKLVRFYPVRAKEAPPEVSASNWVEIKKTAMSHLDRERDFSSRPFNCDYITSKSNFGKVFIDYFPPMPLSFRNQPRAHDTYDDDYMNPSGAGGRFSQSGSYIEERPLPIKPWNSPFWQEINLAIDVLRAQEAGADGFLVDVLRLPFNTAKIGILKLYDVAEHIAPDFKLVPEIDHAALKCMSASDISTALLELETKPATFRIDDGRMLVTPFAPEKCSPQLWRDIIDQLSSAGKKIAFMPVFLNARSSANYASFAYGFSDWGNRDPLVSASSNDRALVQSITGNTIWMEPIAPQDVRPKVRTFYETAGSKLFREGWERAIAERSTFVHVITWNDYSESTEVEPSTGAQFVFYDLLTFYAGWYKSGKQPAISQDALYYLHRQQIMSPEQVQGNEAFRLLGKSPLLNIVEVIAFVTKPATVVIQQGDLILKQNAHPGLNVFQVPAREGQPNFSMVRGSQTVVELKSRWTIEGRSLIPKQIYVGGSSTRPFVN